MVNGGGKAGTGGPGVVIVRVPSDRTLAVTPGCNSTGTAGSCKTATFTVTGTLTIT